MRQIAKIFSEEKAKMEQEQRSLMLTGDFFKKIILNSRVYVVTTPDSHRASAVHTVG